MTVHFIFASFISILIDNFWLDHAFQRVFFQPAWMSIITDFVIFTDLGARCHWGISEIFSWSPMHALALLLFAFLVLYLFSAILGHMYLIILEMGPSVIVMRK